MLKCSRLRDVLAVLCLIGRRQTAPPGAGVDPMLYHWFQAIDTDKSGTLTTEELQRALLNGMG